MKESEIHLPKGKGTGAHGIRNKEAGQSELWVEWERSLGKCAVTVTKTGVTKLQASAVQTCRCLASSDMKRLQRGHWSMPRWRPRGSIQS